MINFVKKYRIVFLLIIFFIFGLCLGLGLKTPSAIKNSLPAEELNITNNSGLNSNNEIIDMAPFWEVWKLLSEKYVATHSTSTISSQDKIWGAIEGLTDSLGDPYTVFMPPTQAEDFKQDISGNFEGIGMEVGIKDNTLSVVSPLKGSPAEKVGIKTGDKIIMINSTIANNLSVDQAVKLIRGPKGTAVKISVLRDGQNKPLEFSVTREIINIPSVKTDIKGNVFIISLFNFYAESRGQFREALKEFIKSKKTKLIIDLRGNPGGFLDAAVDMASWFLPMGKVIVREDFGAKSGEPEKVYRSKGYDIFTDKLKLVILVNEGSASASEILAGALQENGKAKLIGTKTFGKGSVQELISVAGNSSLKVTVARWLTPTGKSISDTGIMPDYVVKITETDIKAGKDPQMEKALEILAI